MVGKKNKEPDGRVVLDLEDIYKRRKVEDRVLLKLTECAFDCNFREDHDGSEVRSSIERIGLDPNKSMLWMEHPASLAGRPFTG